MPFFTENRNSCPKKMFNDFAKQLEGIITSVRSRVNDIEQQEPQYKARENF